MTHVVASVPPATTRVLVFVSPAAGMATPFAPHSNQSMEPR